MRARPLLRWFGFFAGAAGATWALAGGTGRAETPPAQASVPLSATSQCSDGPGAPPADPSKVTRVAAGAAGSAGAEGTAEVKEPSLDEPATPGGPDRVLLEGGIFAGISGRFDDPPGLAMTRRAGLALGGSVFVWPSRLLAFGVQYGHVDLSRSETTGAAQTFFTIDHQAHSLLAEARVTPIRFGPVGLFASIGGGFAWQEVGLRGAAISVGGSPGGLFSCRAGSGAEFAFRGALGMKARVGRAVSVVLDASFLGYRLSADVLDGCAPGAGTAQTLMVRAGLTYDLDITGVAR
ncbi:MAG: hypothetical protein R3F14_31770 [Polyangiaceae bacterium]